MAAGSEEEAAALHLTDIRQVKRLRRQLRLFPGQFWWLVGGTLFYLTFIGLAFPYTAILLKGRLGVSVAVVGAIMGLTALGGLPLQPLAGSLCDRFGRRAVMITCAAMETLMYSGLAFAHSFWLLCALLFCDRALGWPLFLTASNAMVADLVRPRLRPEGYGLVRLMIGAGEIVGPLVAALLLATGVTLPELFLAAGLGCLIYLGFTLLVLKESKPVRRRRAASPGEAIEVFGSLVLSLLPRRRAGRPGAGRPTGYGHVLRDRRFLAFCAVSLLPLFVFGQLYSSFPLLLTSVLHLRPSSWGLLLSFSSAVIVVSQYPAVRAAKRVDPMLAVALASALFGLGVGLVAFVPVGAILLVPVVALSLAQALFGPLSSAIVAQMAPLELRGRYMGSWTLIYIAGQGALGPLLGGLLLDRLGAHTSYGLLIVCGLVGACLYPLLRAKASVTQQQLAG
jgi:MFS family permease